MMHLEQVTIFSLVSPIFVASKFFGFFSFSLDLKKHDVKLTLLNILQTIFTTSVWCLIFLFRFLSGLALRKALSTFSNVGGNCINVLGIFLVIGIVGSNLANRHQLLKILESLENFDQKV